MVDICRQADVLHGNYRWPQQNASDQNNHKKGFGAAPLLGPISTSSSQRIGQYTKFFPSDWRFLEVHLLVSRSRCLMPNQVNTMIQSLLKFLEWHPAHIDQELSVVLHMLQPWLLGKCVLPWLDGSSNSGCCWERLVLGPGDSFGCYFHSCL